ncbi:MAG: D-ribose pyranase [Propionicimonas sp.]|uniref:D-ribose pyranase n=1 Tax=Propionicimonas sp. TaxID=1955623 RepID=UPI002B1E9407|nr:D-ribose pyranase [Propionicimonas sp.]MEA4944725.1 D-ribose pyranase [Propionicimonas sp.]MEA5053214.1 D-ribose pyranase [Propionicimonas sp.]MEA5117318.1 D-ribose pyranase [Propionicimonas sp.]
MKKHGILNADLSYAIAKLGHKQIVFVVDAGMPLPADAPVVDLALVLGVPSFGQVLDALLSEIVVEGSTMASEAEGTVVERWLAERNLHPGQVSHDDLKTMLPRASLIVRTGEATPYANVALYCGVAF